MQKKGYIFVQSNKPIRFKTKLKGFTLIEMIIVMAIIGILISILQPAVKGYLETARKVQLDASFNTTYKGIRGAVEAYESSNREFPVYYPPVISPSTPGENTVFSYNGTYYSAAAIQADAGQFLGLTKSIGDYLPEGISIVCSTQLSQDIRDLPFVQESGGLDASGGMEAMHIDLATKPFPNGFPLMPLYASGKLYGLVSTSDDDETTYSVAFIYAEGTNLVSHIILANEGYYSIDGGEIIKVDTY